MITPEEKAKIENASVLLEWETLAYSGSYMHKLRIIYPIIIFLFFIGCGIYTDELIFFTILAVLIPLAIRFFMWADYQYHYYLTRYGYYYTRYQKVPEFGYKLTAIFMVLGVIVAIIGTMVIGPMAFVGGGMFLLTGILGKGLPLGPDLTRHYNAFHFQFKYILFLVIETKKIWLTTEPMKTDYAICLYYSPKYEKEIISVLTKVLSSSEIYRVKTTDDWSEHPRFKELKENKID